MSNLLDKPAPKTQRGSIPFANESAGIWKLISLSTLADKLRSFFNPIYAATTEPLFSAWLETYVPGGSSGPQSLTISEAEALIGSFAVGEKYIIIDWQPSTLLYADSASVLKPCSGSVTIFNGQELPYIINGETKIYWILPDKLFIDTGNYKANESEPVILTAPIYYFPISFASEFIGESRIGAISIKNLAGTVRLYNGLESTKLYSNTGNILNSVDGYEYASDPYYYISVSSDANLRVLIEFNRMDLTTPIPTPVIVDTPYTSTDGTIITIPYNHLMQSYDGMSSDFTLIVNSTSATISVAYADSTNLVVIPETPFANGDEITISIALGNIKNTWGGVLPEQINVTVVNNVPA